MKLLRANTEHRKVSEVSSRNSETNSFRKGKSELKGKVNLSMEECINVTVYLLLRKAWNFTTEGTCCS
jgi:hypothetical protein